MDEKERARFMVRVEKLSNGCWGWLGSKSVAGYGTVARKGKITMAHRYSYLLFVGAIPAGFVIDHLCRNRACVNPDHLEAVSQRTNILRGESPIAHNAQRTHCVNGHPFTRENTRINKNGHRACRTCDRAYASEQRKRLRGPSLLVANSEKTHCIHGHAFDENNTIYRKDGGRACRVCGRRKSKEHMRRKAQNK